MARPYSFSDEVFLSMRRQRTVLGVVAIVSLVIALAAVSAVASLAPLKETRPFVVLVDKTTGEAEQVYEVRPVNLSEEEAVQQAELVRYVTDRETYDITDNPARIPAVLKISTGQAADSLTKLWTKGNDDYPPRRYGADQRIFVTIKSVSRLSRNSAQVRFTRTLERSGSEPISRSFVATVGFVFRPRVERRLEDVWNNPLGFIVTSYRIDAETLSAQ